MIEGDEALLGSLGVPAFSRRMVVQDADIHYVEAGPQHGPAVVLLHGFPEFWFAWRRQIASLARAGYRVIAPDQRGVNLSRGPARARGYHTALFAQDVIGLMDGLGIERASVVGHDWGGNNAWWLALTRPERVERLVVLGCPHPHAFRRAFLDPRQVVMSWYMLLFQLPRIPEWLCERGEDVLLRSFTEPKVVNDKSMVRAYRASWHRPGALRAMLAAYRSIPRSLLLPNPRVITPTLIVWSEEERYLVSVLAERSAQYCSDARVRRVQGYHWPHHEDPARLEQLLFGFLPPVSQPFLRSRAL